MRNLKTSGIKVLQASAPNLASSRRHFISAATLLGGLLATLTRAGALGRYDQDHHGGGSPHCFLTGTQILTPQGEGPVEDLQIGDWGGTVRGHAKPSKWVGRLRVDTGRQ